jgi:predicted RNase H-like nuclease
MLGELVRARAHIKRHEERAEAISSPWATAVGARCGDLLAALRATSPAALGALDRSLRKLNGLELPLERARTLPILGIVRRQAQERRATRQALDQALVILEQSGARLWSHKSRAELKRIAGRRPASNGLSETEERVAALAAQDRSNKEIAAELAMSRDGRA